MGPSRIPNVFVTLFDIPLIPRQAALEEKLSFITS